jgi:MFS family permease
MRSQAILVCIAKALRTFGFGMVSVMLGMFLKERGFSLPEIGLLISATLVEDAVLSTAISYYANKLGYKNILIVSSMMVIASGLVLGLAVDKLVLVSAVVLGIISPAGFEGGPFASIEHSLITHSAGKSADQSELTGHFSLYNIAGFGGAAIGALVCGIIIALFPGHASQSFPLVFFSYAACGLVMTIIYSFVKVPAILNGSNSKLSKANSKSASNAAADVRSSRVQSQLQSQLLSQSQLQLQLQLQLQSKPKSKTDVQQKKRIWTFAGLQSLDALGGGFVVQTLISLWFYQRYQAGPEFSGPIFFWCNIFAAVSFFLAPAVARRWGLLPTMVFTHLPCSLALCALPFCPTALAAGVLLLSRSLFSSIDIPVRQAYTMLIVREDERVFTAATVNAMRAGGQALSPLLMGLMSLNIVTGLPFILAGLCKSVYDVSLFQLFKNEEIAENSKTITDVQSSLSELESETTLERELVGAARN